VRRRSFENGSEIISERMAVCEISDSDGRECEDVKLLWNIAACYLVEVYGRFRSASFFHLQGDEMIPLMIEAVQTSETSVNSYQSTRRCNPEGSHLHSHRRENLKSYLVLHVPQISFPGRISFAYLGEF
jgi:hypothetical protein